MEMSAHVRIPQYPFHLLPFHTSLSPSNKSRGHHKNLQFRTNANTFPGRFPGRSGGVLRLRCRTGVVSAIRCSNSENLREMVDTGDRPPFDLNLAVVLAGFAFEAYTSPPENVGRREIDAAGCDTVFLSEFFVREVYDGQLFIKLKKGFDFPAMDPWGTSDPYVVINLEGQVAKSKIKWATRETTWNEDFTLNIKKYPAKLLQIAAWDANLVTPHKRMGNAGINLEPLCDGNLHELVLDLEGIGGGGKILLEVKYKSFEDIEKEKQWWSIPFVSDFLMRSRLGSALKVALGSESVNARLFVQFAFGQLKSLNSTYLQEDRLSVGNNPDTQVPVKQMDTTAGSKQFLLLERSPSPKKDGDMLDLKFDSACSDSLVELKVNESLRSGEYFWKNFAGTINQTVLQKLGFSLPEILRWDGLDVLNKLSRQSQKNAEEEYVEYGLATPETNDDADSKSDVSPSSKDFDSRSDSPTTSDAIRSSLTDISKASRDVLSQTETILGALMLLAATFSQQKNDEVLVEENEKKNDVWSIETERDTGSPMNGRGDITSDGSTLDTRKAEETRALFSTAESAMEAWAMLATSLGCTSFIKSEFEKICFLDNGSTDTQVAIWRDPLQRRLVIAFRGTEQAKWKDLRTDLMLVPSGLNPERVGGDFKQEVQVHSGFLSAYDSVRNRIMTLIKLSIGLFDDDDLETTPRWHVYVTGHSLGGALATLLALELSSSRMAKSGAIYVTMYNFGSPRVGNKHFAEVYNEKVKDSWRIVNHRDIIPTVPRLMGYCHVAQPVYLKAVDLKDALVNLELSEDGYQGDVIGESTPDVLVSEFMKGEKQLIEKILETEINLFRSIRDGTALMQHMEDFYYVTLLESVRSNYKTAEDSDSDERSSQLTD